MSKSQYRIAVVGATTLLGKEVSDEIAESPLAAAQTILLDTEDESGTLESVGDEASFIQPLDAEALENVDVAIFTDATMLRQYQETALRLGAAVVDATSASDAAGASLVRSPLLRDAGPLGLDVSYVRCAHPMATALATVLTLLIKVVPVRFAAATILQPASENGRAAVDELQQQAVNLLSFQAVPRDEFDAQVAFNLLPALGESAKNSLKAVEQRILADLEALTGNRLPKPLVQVVQAPVYHGITASLFADCGEAVPLDIIRGALRSETINLVSEEDDPPSNLTSAGQGQLLVRINTSYGRSTGTGLAIWLAADNLKLRARTAVACAIEFTRMRPLGKVQ